MRTRSARLAGLFVALWCGCNQLAGIGDPSAKEIVDAGIVDSEIVDSGVSESRYDAYVPVAFDPCESGYDRCADPFHLSYCRNGTPAEKECWAGCLADSCRAVVPANDLGILDEASGSLTIPKGETAVFDGTTGEIHRCGPGEPFRPVGIAPNGIGFVQRGKKHIWTLRELVVEREAKVRFLSPGPVFLVVGEDVVVDGMIDVSGGRTACSLETLCGGAHGDVTCAGPGGGLGGRDSDGLGPGGGDRGDQGHGFEGGGAGAGHGEGGGAGGRASLAAPGGTTYGEVDLDPIRGGSGGGSGGSDGSGPGGAGGGGGGALQITAARHMQIAGSAFIISSGGGGGAGLGEGRNGGGGGGSGGAILLQAPTINYSGFLLASGGGGGGGDALSDEEGAGHDGNSVDTFDFFYNGGIGSYAGGGGGFLENSGTTRRGEPTDGPGADGSGGGGGSYGRIYMQTLAGEEPSALSLPSIEIGPLFQP